jgi:hypothetical protein
MTTTLDIRTGATGYRDQMERVIRYAGRVWGVEGEPNQRFLVEYQDDVWSFFQNCWHLKDWIKNDPLIPKDVKRRIKAAVESSDVLAIANDMANGTKHLELRNPRAGASHAHLTLATWGNISFLNCMIEVRGSYHTARDLAAECVREWERILGAEGLPVRSP